MLRGCRLWALPGSDEGWAGEDRNRLEKAGMGLLLRIGKVEVGLG